MNFITQLNTVTERPSLSISSQDFVLFNAKTDETRIEGNSIEKLYAIERDYERLVDENKELKKQLKFYNELL